MASQHDKKSVQSGLLHPRNPHRGRYDLDALCRTCPELKMHIQIKPTGDKTIDFSDAKAVLCLNRALLAHYYQVSNWQIPEGYLCPPIPGRADYIHYLADLLAEDLPTSAKGKKIRVLDIGTGANCIYPIIGSQSYGWHFVGTDIDPLAIKIAGMIVQANSCLNGKITLKQQLDKKLIFKGIINEDKFDLTMCNPPFHASLAEAEAGNQRKRKNLGHGKENRAQEKLNFGGQNAELWCPGGEIVFLRQMAEESVAFAKQVRWFSSLLSKGKNVAPLKKLLKQLGCKRIKVVEMAQGQKISRFIAWSFSQE
ncbi:23S rRNA (adenine(1618)-N(6))-methyltransferase RlmF [Desulfotalea psychrophila]|uniref:Ribosomal RNA large subunit methyltransferase F n=1 Tax=Desulfotalea psychrophila (strain LSv54 / DSM 12343) TaxID=177439 RepID=RLMF_DESPS|nr:23S rRNA (adenine(1618)-N(6))-methyltransferase RlmF [Desulfotalea psychrophila]Q6ANQ6.1 RecName: Full=Ribosomal RNA large subunit methyltransferase F; AltName: Full=23S rRNA mA1618 methyltransferase; AltName: Full=rRNA adenine N-6-methyltransferase [Desulfotalea psychrophila LSv54]CAG36018.1 conserved hypothetical protein [Desulfotalea psychrophila LSv54]